MSIALAVAIKKPEWQKQVTKTQIKSLTNHSEIGWPESKKWANGLQG